MMGVVRTWSSGKSMAHFKGHLPLSTRWVQERIQAAGAGDNGNGETDSIKNEINTPYYLSCTSQMYHEF